MAFVQAFTGSLVLNLVYLAFLLFALSSIRSYWRLRNVPGPTWNAWSVIPICYTHYKGRIMADLFACTEKYGPLVRIAPNILLVNDPDVCRRMSDRQSSYVRDDFYLTARLAPGEDNVFSIVDEDAHTARRKKMLAGYSGKENSMLEQDIDACVRDLIALIDTKYTGGTTQMDLARKIQYFTTDVISKIAMDHKFFNLRDDADNYGYITEVENVIPNIASTQALPSLIQALTDIKFLQLFAPSWESSSTMGLGRIMAVTRGQVRKRFNKDGVPNDEYDDMMGSFVRHGLTQSELEQESMLQMSAGSDTTASGLRATLLCIITSPRVHRKLYAEIEDIVAKGNFGTSPDSIVTDEQTQSLPYLQACISEGLRWFPPISALLSKKTPPEGDEICGYQVPGGVAIAISTKAIHRNASLFGPDEDCLRPERWLFTSEGGDETSADKLKAMQDNNELIFGYGKYQCVGMNIAFVELRKVVFELIRRFDFSVVNPMETMKSSNYAVHFQRDLWVTTRRNDIRMLVRDPPQTGSD